MAWVILALAAAAAAITIVLMSLKERQNRDAALIDRVRTSALYRQLYPILEKCQDCLIEQVMIREEEVRITLYQPMNRSVRFIFERHGLDRVDQPDTLRILARAIAVDVPRLAEPDKFFFVVQSQKRDIGKRDVWYEYNVQPDYKDVMQRAWYDKREPEEGVFH